MYRFAHHRFNVPFITPIRTAHGLWSEREGVLVRLENEEGDVGFGEAAPIAAFGTETMAQLEERTRAVPENLREDDIQQVDEAWPCLQFALRSALADVEAAHWARTGEQTQAQAARDQDSSAAAKASDAGPRSAATDTALSSAKGNAYLPVSALLPAGKPALERMAALADAGFRTFKWKVGVGDVADELGLAEEILSRMPNGAKLRLDANGAWNHRQAQKWLERAADWPIEFIEQPIAADSRGFDDTMLGLAADFPTPLALDESIATGAHVAHWMALGWRGYFVIKPALLSRPAETIEAILKNGTRIVFSSALETAVAARESLRLALHYGEAGRAIGFGVWPLFADSRLNGPSLAPFIRREDVERMNPGRAWEALGQ